MRDLEGRVVVVTGGASGIGLGMARAFGAAGSKVVVGDIEKAALDGAVAELTGRGIDALGIGVDVTDPAQMEALAEAAVDAYGAVHVFCNNAGVGGGGLSWETPLATWEWVLGVNLWGVVHGVRTFLPILLQQDAGHLVNTASVAGLVAAPFMGAYTASKHAVVGISETIYHELALQNANVHVSVLCPGWVNTRIADSERNRPAHLADPARGPDEEAQRGVMQQVLQSMLDTGMAPDDVAAQVVDAVRNDRFWILTHRDADGDIWMQAVNRRLDSVRDGTNPPLNLLG
jgi:NAD(P)-dependent dehydrogenase (short-subunit alcohol dehydrogenase family)